MPVVRLGFAGKPALESGAFVLQNALNVIVHYRSITDRRWTTESQVQGTAASDK